MDDAEQQVTLDLSSQETVPLTDDRSQRWLYCLIHILILVH